MIDPAFKGAVSRISIVSPVYNIAAMTEEATASTKTQTVRGVGKMTVDLRCGLDAEKEVFHARG